MMTFERYVLLLDFTACISHFIISLQLGEMEVFQVKML